MDRLSPDGETSGQPPFLVPERGQRDAPRPAPAGHGPEDFPGCEPYHLPASEIDHYEGRLEFWDGRTETAWKVCEPTSIQHEGPSRRLVQMAERVASVRGSRIVCFGSADLVRLEATGRKRWLMQADEVLYLRVERSRLCRVVAGMPRLACGLERCVFAVCVEDVEAGLVVPPLSLGVCEVLHRCVGDRPVEATLAASCAFRLHGRCLSAMARSMPLRSRADGRRCVRSIAPQIGRAG